MRFKSVHEYWVGSGLALVLCIVSLWLAATNQLALYIHPRYVWFTVVLCVLGCIGTFLGFAGRRHQVRVWQPSAWYAPLALVVCVMFCVVLVVFRPAVLTSSTATQRGINTAALDGQALETADTSSSSTFEQFSVKEWASLLAQTNDPAFYEAKITDVIGFVSPAPNNDPDVLYVSRFVVTCCAVDAQPIGVPVHVPDWRASYKVDQWIHVRGGLASRLVAGQPLMVVEPADMAVVMQPENPYAN